MSSNSKVSIDEYVDQILNDWVKNVAAQNSLLGREMAVREQFAGWLDMLLQVTNPERLNELYQLLAIHSRNQALQGRPLSSVMRQILILRETLISYIDTLDPAISSVIDTMLMVVGDGYALGQSQNLRQQWVQLAKDSVPVFRYDQETILSFIAFPNLIEVVDVSFGRALKMVHMHKAKRLVIDLCIQKPLSNRFIETTESLTQTRELEFAELVITGLNPDSEAAKIIGRFPRTHIYEDLEECLSAEE
ncbi:MAG: RsbRD N-terminal domain-containing protein [Myxococcota bacterium]|nr:RsbRD N-terminal domain-containing protein [Myxococcota bacterium]